MRINLYAAKTQLSGLVDQINAGEEVVITRHGRPIARLVPAAAAKSRKPGLLEGKGYWLADDFDAPLPDDLLDLFEGKVREQGTEGPLLDTHLFVWFLVDHKRIPARLTPMLTDPGRIVYVSAVAVWEATIKAGLGKLSLPLDNLEATIAAAGFAVLPVTLAHALEVRHLPPLHRDRFDRLLVAQARHEQLTVLTRDAAIRRYPVDTLWD